MPTIAMEQSSEYAEAAALYRAGDHAGALARIEKLLRDPQLTASQRTFLERQKAICEGKPLSATSSLPPASPAALPKSDCGPRALAILCGKLGVQTTSEELVKLAGTGKYGTTLAGLEKAAKAKGLTAEGIQVDSAALRRLKGVAVAWADGDHYLAVLQVDGDRTTIQDPNETREEVIETDLLLKRSGGILLTVQRAK
jgi:hypothetical protein